MSPIAFKVQELFDDNHHLSDEGVALFVDALRLERVEDLPLEIRVHVDDCLVMQVGNR